MARIIDNQQKKSCRREAPADPQGKTYDQQQLSDKLEVLAIYICRGSISRIEDQTRTVTDMELYGLSQVLNVPSRNFSNNASSTETLAFLIILC